MKASRLDPAFLARPFAHRGLHDKSRGVIENSGTAIHAAVDAGYGIEIDIQMSGDGVPIVFHDYDLKRLTGTAGFVREIGSDRLKNTKLVGGSDGIPALADVLDIVDGQVPLLVEIKDQDMRLGPNVGPLQKSVADLVTAYGGPVAVMSFNPCAMVDFAAYAPHIPCGLVTEAFDQKAWPTVPRDRLKHLVDIPDASNADFVSHDRADLGSPAIRRLKVQGMPILCWTVRSAEEETAARQIADQITFESFRPSQ